MKTLATVCGILALFSSSLFSQSANLWVQHPQRFTGTYGSLEDVRLVITPKGVYTQNDLYMTFSGRSGYFLPSDSVEVSLDFELPKDCIVNDLWLWIDQTVISQGLILDRWTATSIYENIVRRLRRDPALLTRDSYSWSTFWDYYHLKVYPMLGNGTRKVKISYLVPSVWSSTTVSTFIPAHIFRTSYNKPSYVTVDYVQSAGWGTPRIENNPALQFNAVTDSAYGPLLRCEIPSSDFSSYGKTLNLVVGSPMNNGIYLSHFQVGDEGVYHLALVPAKVLGLKSAKKVVFLFDYDSTKTSLQKTDILYNVRSHLETNYSAADSFNLVFTQNSIVPVGNRWFGADLAGIADAFRIAGPSPIVNKTNLPELIKKGIEFLKQNGNSGSLCIVAASDRLGDYQVANPAINEIMQLLPQGVTLSVIDLLNRSYNYYYIGGKYYTGNDYLYENLTKMTRGYWASARSSSMPVMLNGFSQFIMGSVAAFDMYTRLENGICYSRFTSGIGVTLTIASEVPVLQVGKSKGAGAFIVDVVGIFNGAVTERRIVLPENETAVGDTFATKAWTGRYISSLDQGNYNSNSVISEIVTASLRERVLSRYTAFLALEPGDTTRFATQPPTGGTPFGGPTSVEDQTETATEEPLVQAYPNPFNAQTSIRLRLPKGITSDQVSLKIYNTLGQLVRTLSTDGLSDRQTKTIVWNGRNDYQEPVASGIYFFVLSTPKGQKSLKLVMLK